MVVNTWNSLFLEVALFEKIESLKNLGKFMAGRARVSLQRLEDALTTALPVGRSHSPPIL